MATKKSDPLVLVDGDSESNSELHYSLTDPVDSARDSKEIRKTFKKIGMSDDHADILSGTERN